MSNKKPEPCQNEHDAATQPDWERTCKICGETPIITFTGMCGPCTFGEAESVGVNW